MEASGPVGVVLRYPVGHLGQRRSQLVEAGSGARARRDDASARHELFRLDARELERLLVEEVGLRERDDAVLDPEQAQDREVLVRLRPCASPTSMTSRKRSIPLAPATIVRTNRSCPGTSTTERLVPSGSSSGA